jgi:hypothetical protein
MRTGPLAQAYTDINRFGGEAEVQQLEQQAMGARQAARERPGDLRRATENLDIFSRNLGEAAETVKEYTEQVKEGRQLSKEQVQEMRRAGLQARGYLGAYGQLQRIAPEQEITPGQLAGRETALDIQQQLQQQQFEGAGPPGFGQRMQAVGKRLMSGWGLMQLRRFWGMTGGPAFAAIPAAAQEEQAAAQAAMAGMPMSQYQPGGMTMDLMTMQARQQNRQVAMGQAAYGGYGWLMGQGGQGLGTLEGLARPALGAGLIGGTIASWAGMGAGAAAAGVGLPIALGTLGIAAGAYTYNAAQDEERMALASIGEGNVLERAAAMPHYSSQVAGREQLGTRQAYGQRLMTGELEGLTPAGRIAAIQKAAEIATSKEGAVPFLSQTSAEQMAGSWMRLTPGATNIKDIFEDPRFEQMALQGIGPEQYAGMAQQWGAMPTDWQGMQGVMGGMTGPQRTEFMASQQFLAPLARFGLTPAQAAQMGPVRGAQNQRMLQGLASGSPFFWSQLGREAGVTDWQTQSAGGIGIGVNWGGGILGGYMGQVGAVGQNVQGGMVNIGGQQVGFNQWGLQDFGRQQQRGMQDWQFQFRMEGLGLQQQRQYEIWGFQDEGTALQRGYQRQQFGFQGADIARNDRQWNERWNMQYQQLGITSGWQAEDRERQYGRQQVRFDWAEEDLAFRGAQSQLQFGWQMEDLEESERFATGRGRRRIRRQRERASISFGMSMGRLDEEGERLEQRREWAEEDYEKAKDRHETTLGWRRKEMELSRKHHEEDVDAQRERLAASVAYFEETAQLQDRQRDAARDYWEETHERQERALKKEQDYQKLVRQTQDAQTALARAQLLHVSQFRAEFEAGSLLDMEMHAFIDRIVDHLQEAGAAMDSFLQPKDPWNGVIGGR